MERHPRLRILFPHFFFLSCQLKRLAKILDSYPNVWIDLTPGIELYYNLSAQGDTARQFIDRYQNRIIYGTDMGARVLIRKEDVPLSIEECRSRVKLIRDFLETKGDYLLTEDGYYVVERDPVIMHGLGLSEEVLNKIYHRIFWISSIAIKLMTADDIQNNRKHVPHVFYCHESKEAASFKRQLRYLTIFCFIYKRTLIFYFNSVTGEL